MPHSKSQVDRAGKFLAASMLAATEDARRFAPGGKLGEAIEIVDWWREDHARPLSQVAANLRYYAAEHGTPVVAQRLKKLSTIADKLLRGYRTRGRIWSRRMPAYTRQTSSSEAARLS